MTVAPTHTLETVRTLVVAQLKLDAQAELPGPDDDLWGLGMTSLALLGLTLSIEDAFEISLPDGSLTESTFRTLTTISAAVEAARTG
jgi:acyl carrier protein